MNPGCMNMSKYCFLCVVYVYMRFELKQTGLPLFKKCAVVSTFAWNSRKLLSISYFCLTTTPHWHASWGYVVESKSFNQLNVAHNCFISHDLLFWRETLLLCSDWTTCRHMLCKVLLHFLTPNRLQAMYTEVKNRLCLLMLHNFAQTMTNRNWIVYPIRFTVRDTWLYILHVCI